MNKFTLKDLTTQVMVAAIYVTLTVAFHFTSYGDIQFRIAEVMLILVFFNPKHSIGIIIGTFIANLFSPFGILDSLIGTLASVLAIIPMIFLKKYWYGTLLIPAITNGLLVSSLICYIDDVWQLYWVIVGQVFIGELVVLLILGIPFYIIINRNKPFKSLLEN